MSFIREMFEYEYLFQEPALNVEFGAEFTEGDAKNLFKRRVSIGVGPTGRPNQLALKYSAFYRSEAGGCVFMLGWDHAMLVRRNEDSATVLKIFASGDSDTVDENAVFDLTGEDLAKVSFNGNTLAVAGKTWRRYDLEDKDLTIEKLVTFSITSCSFACVWPDDMNLLLVSHVAFSPPIPLFTIYRSIRPVIRRESDAPRHDEAILMPGNPHLNLLASLNNTVDELDKFTAAHLPDATEFDITAKFLLRGPYKCRDAGVFAPFKTHPYVTLDFTGEEILFGGALGFNNDPNMEVEMPPFHSTIGSAINAFNTLLNAKTILEKEKELLNDNYGFMRLHFAMLAELMAADLADVDSYVPWHSKYKSDKVDVLIAQTKQAPLVTDAILQDPLIKGKIRAIFLLAELTTNPKNPLFKLAFDAVMKAWAKEQMSFKFRLEIIHQERAALRKLVPVVIV